MNAMNNEPVRIYSTIKARPEVVFDAWIEPKIISKWMFKPFGDKVISISTKAFPGTQFSFVVEREGQKINHHGEYIEVRRPHRLVKTWGVEGHPIGHSRVSIDFEPNGDHTYMTLTHRGVDPEYLERTRQGWTKMIDALQEMIGR